MKKYFFYLSMVSSFMVMPPLEAMFKARGILNALKNQTSRLSSIQSHYLEKGRDVFLKDLSDGVVPGDEVQNVARLFTQKPFIQPEHYIQTFSDRVETMEKIRRAVSCQAGYATVATALSEEIVHDSFNFAKIAIDIDVSILHAIVDQVPAVLRKKGEYWHGFTTRDGTLLDYVEDEINETLDAEILAKLVTAKKYLEDHGAKLHTEALS